MKDLRVVLISKSPRRKELVGRLGFEVVQSPAPERVESALEWSGDFKRDVLHCSESKMKWALEQPYRFERELLLSADTMVLSPQKKPLGKPCDQKEARQMLMLLEDQWHEVYSAVSLCERVEGKILHQASFLERTRVRFGSLEAREIEAYLAGEEWTDKAGGYGIQGQAGLWIERIEGCFYNVMGLPLAALLKKMRSWGIFCLYKGDKSGI